MGCWYTRPVHQKFSQRSVPVGIRWGVENGVRVSGSDINNTSNNQVTGDESSSITVLVVEDETINYLLVQTILKRAGISAVHAKNGEQAIEFCRERPDINVVLMDIRLPTIDGVETTERIRTFRPNLPIIAQTAYAMDEDRERFGDVGFDGQVTKPIAPDHLVATVRELSTKEREAAG